MNPSNLSLLAAAILSTAAFGNPPSNERAESKSYEYRFAAQLAQTPPPRFDRPQEPALAGDLPFPPPKMIEGAAAVSTGAVPRPAANSGRFKRPTTIIDLPGRFDELRVGGGGRYLITWHAAAKKLVVIDVRRRMIVRHLPIDGSDVVFAAGREKLVVAHGTTGVIARYDLNSGSLEKSATIKGLIYGLAMGSGSDGPIMIIGYGVRDYITTRLVDLETLELFGPTSQMAPSPRASADGTVFAAAAAARMGATTLYLRRVRGKLNDPIGSVGINGQWAIPSVDGRHVYIRDGVLNLVKRTKTLTPEPTRGLTFHLPAASGKLFLRLSTEPTGNEAAVAAPTLSLYVEGYEKPLRLLDDVAEVPQPTEVDRPWGKEYRLDQQLLLLPAARALVTAANDDSQLWIQDFDAQSELAKSQEDYLFVESSPPGVIRRFQKFKYQIVAKARRPPVRFELRYAPTGATLSPTGLLEWTNNTDNQRPSFTVIVHGASGQLEHAFDLLLDPQSK
jgi:hypothetical protein